MMCNNYAKGILQEQIIDPPREENGFGYTNYMPLPQPSLSAIEINISGTNNLGNIFVLVFLALF